MGPYLATMVQMSLHEEVLRIGFAFGNRGPFSTLLCGSAGSKKDQGWLKLAWTSSYDP